MSHVRVSARAILERDGELLVLRCHDEGGDWYVCPGGGQRPGEGLEATLAREVMEETGAGVRVGPLRFVRELMAGPRSRGLPAGFHQLELFFSCTLESTPSAHGGAVPDRGQLGVEWHSLARLRELPFFPPALLDALACGQAFGYLGIV